MKRKKYGVKKKSVLTRLKELYISFGWYLKRNPYLVKFLLIPIGSLTILIFIAWLFIRNDKISAFLNNLVNTLFGIIITVTFVSYILFKEKEKIYKNLQMGIIRDLDNLIHKFLWFCLNEFLEPTDEEKYKELLQITPEPYTDWNYKNRYWRKKEFVTQKMEDLFKKASLNRIKEYQKIRDVFLKEIFELKKRHLDVIDQDVMTSLESIISSSHCCMIDDPPGHKGERESAGWYNKVYMDISEKFKTCLNTMNSLIEWEEEILRFEKKPY